MRIRKPSAYLCMHMTHERVGHAKCARYNSCLGYTGTPPHVLKENGWSSLSLLACTWGSGQRIIGLPEKRIIRGGSLGSSAANPGHLPLLYRWEGKGDWCSLLEQR